MAGVGEASAIVALVGTAATLSKAVVDIASKYKDARKEIEFFGREVGVLGNVLDQLYRLHEKDHLEADDGVHSVTMTILDQCAELFAKLDIYKDALYSRPGSVRGLTFLGKAKWVFNAAELEYLRARLESVKTNLLLMMAMQCINNSDRSRNDRTIQELLTQSGGWVKRLETLEKGMMRPNDSGDDPAVNRMSINVVDTADSARSTRDSILSLYGHRSYYQKILDPRGAPSAMALELQADYARVSRIIEDHLEDDLQPAEAASAAVDEGLEIHAYGGTKPADSSQESKRDVHTNPSTKSAEKLRETKFLDFIHRYPCCARAIKTYVESPSQSPSCFSFARNEVLLVKSFSGTTWQVKNNTGREGLAPSHYLIPHYPYLARVDKDFPNSHVLRDELLYVSDKVRFNLSLYSWRPWRKKTGETGVAPDFYFQCFYKQLEKPRPPIPPRPSSPSQLFDSMCYTLLAHVCEDDAVKADDPSNVLSLTEMET